MNPRPWLMHLTLALVCGASAWAMDLTPYAKPNATLAKDLAAQRAALWHALLVDGYQKNGDHGQATDTDLAKLLDHTARQLVGVATADPAMTALAERLAGDGGNPDPLAAFSWFVANNGTNWAVANTACTKAIAAFEKDDATHQPVRYAHLIRANLYGYALGRLHPDRHPEQLERATATAAKMSHEYTASIIAHEFDLAPASFLRGIRNLNLNGKETVEGLITDLTGAFATAKTDPWIAHAVLTQLGIDAAWEWRGSGWASTVTEEGWKGFARHLTAAEHHLTEAHRLHPEEPLLGVMGINLAGADHSAVTKEEWLTRSIAACFDNSEAFDKYRQFGTPRWGGKYADLLSLGCDAAATKRYDTTVPMQLFYTVGYLVGDAQSMKLEKDLQPALAKPSVRQAVSDCVAGYTAQNPAQAAEYQCWEVGYLWHSGDKAGARKLLLSIDPTQRKSDIAKWMHVDFDQLLADTEPAAAVSF